MGSLYGTNFKCRDGDAQMDWSSIKPKLWSAAGGAVVLAVIGFTWGGWTAGSKARSMAAEAAEIAVIARLAPICVSQYGQDPNKQQKLKDMKAIDSWNRGDYVGKQGWSTMLGEKAPDSQVSRKCAELLSEMS